MIRLLTRRFEALSVRSMEGHLVELIICPKTDHVAALLRLSMMAMAITAIRRGKLY